MTELTFTNALTIFHILLQVAAGYFAYAIYRRNRRYLPWLAIAIALLLIVIRRVSSLFINVNLFKEYAVALETLDQVIVPTLASILFLYACYTIKKEFDEFRP